MNIKQPLAGLDATTVLAQVEGIEVESMCHKLTGHFGLKEIVVEAVEVHYRAAPVFGGEQPDHGATLGAAVVVGLVNITHLKRITENVLMPALRLSTKPGRKAHQEN